MQYFKHIVIIFIIILLLIIATHFVLSRPVRSIDQQPANTQQIHQSADTTEIPQFITTDFIDLKHVKLISKFRSGAGHDFSGGGETCRSMKHYFQPPGLNYINFQHYVPKKPYIPIYAPADGKIVQIQEEHTPIGKQIYLQPTGYEDYVVRLFHIFPKDDLSVGDVVRAGEQLGYIGDGQGTDIAVQTGFFFSTHFISYFDVMAPAVFAGYQKYGITSKDQLIITKTYRDAHPFNCNGEQFVPQHMGFSSEDYVMLYYKK